MQKEAVQKEAVQKEAVQKEAVQKEAVQKEAVQKEAVQKEAVQKERRPGGQEGRRARHETSQEAGEIARAWAGQCPGRCHRRN